MANWIKARDPGRLRKYERDNRDGFVDIMSVQYPSPSGAQNGANGTNMPYFMSEYEHAMGNAPGSLVEFWDVFRSVRNAQGGFAWDFIDQSVWMPTPMVYRSISDKPVLTANVNGGIIAAGEGRNGSNALKGYIEYPVQSALNANSTGITIEAWILPTSVVGNAEIVSKGDSGYALKYNSSGNIEFFVNGYSAGTVNAAPPANWLDGNWKLLTAVYDSTQAAANRYRVYINGQHHAYGSRSGNGALDNNVGLGLCIGESAQYKGRKFPGLIDSVRIYNTALNQTQIQNNERAATDANVIYWNDFNTFTADKVGDDDTYFAYGGDWGESVHDGSFSGNGMVFADRTPKPYMTEVKYAQQEVWYTSNASQLAAGRVQIANEFLNTNLNAYNHEWEILKDGVYFDSGTLELNTAPSTSETVTIPRLLNIVPEPGSEYLLNLRATLKTDKPWAKAGYPFATAQFILPIASEENYDEFDPDVYPDFTSLVETTTQIVAEGADFSITFNKTKAEITSIIKDGKELIASGPIIAHWRSPGDNDTGYNSSLRNTWGNATNIRVTVAADTFKKFVTIEVQSALSGNASNTTTYTIYSNGEIVVKNRLQPSSSGGNLLRVGMSMKLAEGIDNIEYYGRGPVENYSDRNVGTHAGIFKAKTQDQYTPYLRPQFFGNRTDVRWYSVTDAQGNGLLINGTEFLSASASNYDDLEFNSLPHMYLAPKLKTPILNIDKVQAPLGSAACGPGPLDKYLVKPTQAYEYTYRIMPITAADTAFKVEAVKRAIVVAPSVDGPISITYNLNGGSGTTAADSKRPGLTFTVAGVKGILGPAGKLFVEWNTQADGTGISYEPGAKSVAPNAALTLYAIWAEGQGMIVGSKNDADKINTVTIRTVNPEKTALILAAYDADNRLLNFKQYQPEVAGEEDISVDFGLSGADSIRAFLWGADDWVPLCPAKYLYDSPGPDMSGLLAAIQKAGSLDVYTRLSSEDAYAALEQAQAVYGTRKPPVELIEAATDALNAALGKLVIPPLSLFTKLTGTVYGNGPPYSAGSEYDKVFDGNTNTFFDHSTGGSGYAGIDLGSGRESSVQLIRAYPRSGQVARLNSCTFRGSMTISTGGNTGTLLHTVSGVTTLAWHQFVPSNTTDIFRYIWFMSGPDSFGNVSEVEFYIKTGVDRSLLDNRIAYAKSLLESSYTNGSWATLQSALLLAEGLAAGASQTQVDSATSALKTAIAGLILV
jgi:hypothetical protein